MVTSVDFQHYLGLHVARWWRTMPDIPPLTFRNTRSGLRSLGIPTTCCPEVVVSTLCNPVAACAFERYVSKRTLLP